MLVLDFTAFEKFVNEKGNIPQVVPDYNLGNEGIVFCVTVDIMTNIKEYAIRSSKTEHRTNLKWCYDENHTFPI